MTARTGGRGRGLCLLAAGAVAVALAAVPPASASAALRSAPAAEVPGVLYATSALTAKDVWSVGYVQGDSATTTPLAEHYDGKSWQREHTPLPHNSSHGLLHGVAAISSNDVWAVGSRTLTSNGASRTLAEHWNGTKWTVVPTVEPSGVSSSYLESVTAVAADDVWAVGYDYQSSNGKDVIEHWNGKKWSLVKGDDPTDFYNLDLQSVNASSATDVWAAGFYFNSIGAGVTFTEHWNGKAWHQEQAVDNPNSPDTEFQGVTAISKNDAWATGFTTLDGSTYLTLTEHWDGSSWSVVDSPNPAGSNDTYLYGIDALSANNVWAVGYYIKNGSYATLAEHWDGSSWTIVDTENRAGSTSNYLYGVSGVSGKDVWASGYAFANADELLVEHWDGKKWSVVPVK